MRLLVLATRVIVFAILALPLQAALAGPVPVERIIAPSGVEAYFTSARQVPVVALRFSFEGGTARDPEDRLGRANLAARLLDQGAGDLDAREFQQRLSELAATLRIGVGRDRLSGFLYATRDNIDEAADLLRLALAEPRFDADAIARRRAGIADEIRGNLTDPGWLGRRALLDAIMADHPYARPSRGTLDTLDRIEAADLRATMEETVARDRLTVAVVGDLDEGEATQLLERIFAGLPASAPLPESGPGHEIPQWQPPQEAVAVHVERRGAQSLILMAHEAISPDDEDYWAARVVEHVLGGGGMGSRLMVEVRARRGLTYGVRSSLSHDDAADMIMVSARLAHGNVEPAVGVIADEWARMREEGPNEDELDDAIRYLTGSFPLGLTSTSEIAGMLMTMQHRDWGIDFLERRNDLIEAVDAEAAARAARRLLEPARLHRVVVGPDEQALPFDIRRDMQEMAERELGGG